MWGGRRMVTGQSGNIGSALARRSGVSIRPARSSAICLVVLFLLSETFVDFGWGQEGPPSEPPPRNFQIPSQPLAIALEAFARESGIEVLYESSIVASLQSTSVEGAYTPEMALQTLLSRTELRVRYARENAKTLSLPGSDDRWSVSGRSRRDGRATGTEATRRICEYGFFFFRNLRSIKVEVH